jgi:hypothetical protein
MGYNTDFEGVIGILPPMTVKDLKTIEKFIENPGSNNAGIHTSNCDFKFNDDGTGILWNGYEKSYEMEVWLPFLITKFFKPMGYKLNGTMLARGESMSDHWRMVVKDNIFSRLEGHADHTPGEAMDEDDLAIFLSSTGLEDLDRDDLQKVARKLLKQFSITRK